MVSISPIALVIQIVNFLFLIFALNMVLYKPIRNVLRQRKGKIEGLAEGVDSTKQQAEDKNQAFLDGIKSARSQGQQKKEVFLQAAAEEEQTIIGKINAKAKEDLAAVKAKIAQDTDAVRSSLEKEVDAFADAIAQKILGRAA